MLLKFGPRHFLNDIHQDYAHRSHGTSTCTYFNDIVIYILFFHLLYLFGIKIIIRQLERTLIPIISFANIKL